MTVAATQQESQEEIEPWLAPGTEVVLKASDIPLRDGEWLALSRDHLTFSIEKVSGERLLLASHDKTQCGWMLREYVVPLEGAVDYFSREIARTPHLADAYWMRGRVWAYRSEDEPRDRRLRSGDPAPARPGPILRPPRPRPHEAAALRQGARGLRQGHPARSEGGRGVYTPFQHPPLERRARARTSPTWTGRLASTPSSRRTRRSRPRGWTRRTRNLARRELASSSR